MCHYALGYRASCSQRRLSRICEPRNAAVKRVHRALRRPAAATASCGPSRCQGRPLALSAGRLSAAVVRHDARRSRSKLQCSHVRPCIPGTQLAPPRAPSRPPPPSKSYMHQTAAEAAGAAPAFGCGHGRLCTLQRVCPKPITSAASRPHEHRAAAAPGLLCARDRRTCCMPGVSPAHARRAGRMPMPAGLPSRARPRWPRCVRQCVRP